MFKIKYFIFFVALMLLSYNIYPNYLANIEMEVNSNGLINITGQSDYPDFNQASTYKFISMQKNVWIIDINTPIFDKYYYSIVLPPYSEINYISSINKIKISDNSYNQIQISAYGDNQPIQLKIQYTIDKNTKKGVFWVIYLIIGIILIIGGYFLYKHKPRIKDKQVKEKEESTNNKLSNSEYQELNSRQKEIIEIIKKEGTATQNYIQKKLSIPKSSVSRNIQSLESKGIIETKKFGMTNTIVLKKK